MFGNMGNMMEQMKMIQKLMQDENFKKLNNPITSDFIFNITLTST